MPPVLQLVHFPLFSFLEYLSDVRKALTPASSYLKLPSVIMLALSAFGPLVHHKRASLKKCYQARKLGRIDIFLFVLQLAACSTFPILIQRAPHEAQQCRAQKGKGVQLLIGKLVYIALLST